MGPNKVNVKTELPDEAEIVKLAAEMVKANKKKLEEAARITKDLINKTFKSSNQTVIPEQPRHFDEESRQGKFGWITLGNIYHLPYIYRKNEKYCSVRMAEFQLLKKYLSYLNPKIYLCFCLESFHITEYESKLFNEINKIHCDSYFGNEAFTTSDLIVQLSELSDLYEFLKVCYNKLISKMTSKTDKCGFIKIQGQSLVPFIVKDNKKYLPMFYFEGEIDCLEGKAMKMDGWNLAYLKFCCLVQGIRNELFLNQTINVIDLDEIKNCFSSSTKFDLDWPLKITDQALLLPSEKKSMDHARGGLWTQRPTLPKKPPENPRVSTAPNGNTNVTISSTVTPPISSHGSSSTINAPYFSNPNIQQFHPTYQIQPLRQQNPSDPIILTQITNGTSSNKRLQAPHYHQKNLPPTIQQNVPPQYSTVPPLYRLQLAQPTNRLNNFYTTANGMQSISQAIMTHPKPVYNVASDRHQLPAQLPPGTSSSRMMNQTTEPTSMTPTHSNINATKPGKRLAPATHNLAKNKKKKKNQTPVLNQQATNYSNQGVNNPQLLVPISALQTQAPTSYQMTFINRRAMICLNVGGQLALTLDDLVAEFYPNISTKTCFKVLRDVLKLDIFRADMNQMKILYELRKCKSLDEIIFLIQTKDVLNFMPQMQYMFSRIVEDKTQ